MFHTVYAVSIAVPIIALLILFTVLLSWRWVAGFMVAAGAAMLWLRMSYGMFANPPLARIVLALLVQAGILAAVTYAAGLIWYLARTCDADASSEPHRVDR